MCFCCVYSQEVKITRSWGASGWSRVPSCTLSTGTDRTWGEGSRTWAARRSSGSQHRGSAQHWGGGLRVQAPDITLFRMALHEIKELGDIFLIYDRVVWVSGHSGVFGLCAYGLLFFHFLSWRNFRLSDRLCPVLLWSFVFLLPFTSCSAWRVCVCVCCQLSNGLLHTPVWIFALF